MVVGSDPGRPTIFLHGSPSVDRVRTMIQIPSATAAERLYFERVARTREQLLGPEIELRASNWTPIEMSS